MTMRCQRSLKIHHQLWTIESKDMQFKYKRAKIKLNGFLREKRERYLELKRKLETV